MRLYDELLRRGSQAGYVRPITIGELVEIRALRCKSDKTLRNWRDELVAALVLTYWRKGNHGLRFKLHELDRER